MEAALSSSLPGFTPAWWALLVDRELSATEVRLYLILASHARAAKPVAFPGQDRLAGLMGCSVDTVQRSLTALQKRGWIQITRRGVRRTNLYHLLMPAPRDVDDVVDTNFDGASDTAPVRLLDTAPMRLPNRSKERVSNPPNPQRGNGELSAAERADDFEAWWKHYPRKEAKVKARAAWRKSLGVLPEIAKLTAAVDTRIALLKATHPIEWARYMPHPATWLNQQRWDDEIGENGYTSPVAVRPKPCGFCGVLRPSDSPCQATSHGYEEKDCPWK